MQHAACVCWTGVLFVVRVCCVQDVDATVGCNGTALQLNSVWWLDISGDITGAGMTAQAGGGSFGGVFRAGQATEQKHAAAGAPS